MNMNCACSITTITFVSASTSRDLSIYSIKGSMSSAHAIVQQLFRTGQPTAVGIGYFLKALLDFAMPSGIIVEHKNKEGATRVMMFGRQRLSTSFDTAVDIIKKDFGIRGYSHSDFTITGVLFYNRDGTVQETPMSISQESWADLMGHVYKIFIRTS